MERPIRVINDDTSDQEMQAGHRIPNADPPKNDDARGGFGNREGKEGYGSDTASGATALGVNETADRVAPPADNMRADDQGRPGPGNDDMPDNDDEDGITTRRTGPIDELDADDYRTGPDEMSNPNSRVGMGEMEPRPRPPVTGAGTDTNAELNDPDASDTAIDQ